MSDQILLEILSTLHKIQQDMRWFREREERKEEATREENLQRLDRMARRG